jgi:16S rRNA (cytosine967-C5)-methyltransferase
VRIDTEGAYANLLLPTLLERTSLARRDRGFVTELVYGVTRMRRSCDWLVDRFLPDPGRIDPTARAWLRLGAFQLVFLDTPAHAAVGATVESAPGKLKGLLNAVLRKVAAGLPVTWPDEATRLSEPDWIIRRLTEDLGESEAVAALEAMNRPPSVTTRDDGYVQDQASQWVAEAVGAASGELVLDMCAAPGGKATAMAGTGARVVAADIRPARLGLVVANAARLGLDDGRLSAVAADGTHLPLRPASFDKVLLDAPCSGLGALRRRPDARWRITEDDVATLAALQLRLVEAALTMVRPGGELTYSVCTLTSAESQAVDEHLARAHPDLVALPSPRGPWRALGRGALLLPQDADTDGMYLLRVRVAD